MIKKIQHNLNSLHVYCKIKRAGLPTVQARKIAALYEKMFHCAIYSEKKSNSINSNTRGKSLKYRTKDKEKGRKIIS